jgi:hypothetical protein
MFGIFKKNKILPFGCRMSDQASNSKCSSAKRGKARKNVAFVSQERKKRERERERERKKRQRERERKRKKKKKGSKNIEILIIGSGREKVLLMAPVKAIEVENSGRLL